MPRYRQRAVVMGGSLGGLTAALLLRDDGWEVDVYERSSAALSSRGAGIVVHDMTVRYFVERDVLDITQVSTDARWLRYLRRDGSIVHEERCRYRFTAWNTLYRTLRSCLDADRYHLGHEIVAFEQDEREVDVRFADGQRVTCDLLVCADGISSTARALLLPDVQPRYAGYVGWRGTARESELSAPAFACLSEAIVYHVMPNSHILVYPIPSVDGSLEPGSRLANFVWYRNVRPGAELDALMTDRWGEHRDLSVPPGAVQQQFVAELRATARSALPEVIAEAVEKTPEPFIQAIFDVEVPRMAFGRICLMGDAAFSARPHAAAGTAKAAADAWGLAEALRDEDDVPAALRSWERRQLELGRRLVERARRLGERSQFEGTFTPGDPSLAFGLYGPGQ